MSERLAHRELRNRSAEILRDVQAGATYEITNHGVVVAVLAPPTAPVHLRVRPAKVHGGFGELVRVDSSQRTRTVLDDLREER